MRINIISYDNGYGLSKDIFKLKTLLLEMNKNLDIKIYNFYDYKCREADLNIYLEVVNNLLIKFAKYNVMIPNQEWYYRHWIPYLNNFDLILVKTDYAYNIFKSIPEVKNVQYLGWSSYDKYKSEIYKFNLRCLHLCGRSIYKQTQKIINNWKPDYLPLTILYSPKDVKLKLKNQSNITYITQKIDDKQLKMLMNTHSIHLCCSETEGFGHYINEAKSCQALVVTTNAPPMSELIDDNNGVKINYSQEVSLPESLGHKYEIDDNHFHQTISSLINLSEKEIVSKGELARNSYLENEQKFKVNLKSCFQDLLSRIQLIPRPLIKNEEISKDLLPTVSIVTLVYNRKRFFKLSLLNFMSIDYPKHKLEWIIIDDSKESEKVKNLVPKEKNIHYLEYKRHLTIGNKRNLAIEKCHHEMICFMDDDDYYPPESVRTRINWMLNNNKKCVTCTTIGCFHINKYISMINVPPHQLSFENRISEASLAFTKSFWEKQKFDDNSRGGEAREFLINRYQDCCEISWQGVIVSLMHSSNTSDKVTMSEKPNGCHFGFSNKLFSFVTSLDRKS